MQSYSDRLSIESGNKGVELLYDNAAAPSQAYCSIIVRGKPALDLTKSELMMLLNLFERVALGKGRFT